MRIGELIAGAAVGLIILMGAQGLMGDPKFSTAMNILQGPGQPAQPAASGNSVVGGPSISAQFAENILCTYQSPACNTGLGQALHSLSLEYNIDNAYALAFFFKESTFGKAGVARDSLSIGNLRCIPDARCIANFAYFNSWQEGARAWFKLIRSLYVDQWQLTTASTILARYAPSADGNNPTHYAQVVESAVSLWRQGKVALP